jgi:hypothetical protein
MTPGLPTRRYAIARCVFVALIALMCAGLLAAAALVPAPPVVVPLIAVVCVGCPLVAGCELAEALDRLRATPRARALDPLALDDLRRQLDSLPETQHPLGL